MLLLLTHARAAAPATLRRALPVFAALALVGMVFFGRQGVSAHDVTSLAEANPLGRAGLWLLWLLPLAPAAHALLDPPGLTYLRTLPVAPARLWAVSALLLLAFQVPAGLFVTRGAGPAAGAGALFFATAAHAQAFAGLRRPVDLALALALVAAFVLATPPWLVAPLAVASTWRAWRMVPERAATRAARRLPARPVMALAFTHLLGVVRRERAAAGRAALLLALLAAFAALIARNNGISDAHALERLALGVAAPALALALSGLVTAMLVGERGARELLDAAGTPPSVRVIAIGLASAALGAASGLVFAAALALVRSAPPPPLVAAGIVVAGAAVGALLAGVHRHAIDDAARATHRLLGSVLAVGGVTALATGTLGLAGLPLVAIAAVAALWGTLPLAVRPHEPADPWGRE